MGVDWQYVDAIGESARRGGGEGGASREGVVSGANGEREREREVVEGLLAKVCLCWVRQARD